MGLRSLAWGLGGICQEAPLDRFVDVGHQIFPGVALGRAARNRRHLRPVPAFLRFVNNNFSLQGSSARLRCKWYCNTACAQIPQKAGCPHDRLNGGRPMSPNIPETNKLQHGSAWKRIALISIFAGAGVVVALALITAAFIWYSSLPEPPKLWNAKALIVSEPPSISSDGESVTFIYKIANATPSDYKIESAGEVRMMARLWDGRLTGPISERGLKLGVPVFIPVGQRSTLHFDIFFGGIPTKGASESDKDYQGRLNNFLQEKYADIAGFSIFDERNRYQIDLPKWSSEKSSPTNEDDPLGLFSPYGAALAECLTKVNPNDPAGLYTDDPAQARRRQECIDRYRTRK